MQSQCWKWKYHTISVLSVQSEPGVANLGYMHPLRYICLYEVVHLRLAIKGKIQIHSYIMYFDILNMYKWILKKSLYAYCQIHLWLFMIKYFVMRNFRGTCSFVEILKGCMIKEKLETPDPNNKKIPAHLLYPKKILSMGVRRNVSRGEKARHFASAYPFQL